MANTVFSPTVSPMAAPAIAVNAKLNAVVVTLVATTPMSRHMDMYAIAAKNMMKPDSTDRKTTHGGVSHTLGAEGDVARNAAHARPTAADRIALVPSTVNGMRVEMTCDVDTAAEYNAGFNAQTNIVAYNMASVQKFRGAYDQV
jgi:hypothetical protein